MLARKKIEIFTERDHLKSITLKMIVSKLFIKSIAFEKIQQSEFDERN